MDEIISSTLHHEQLAAQLMDEIASAKYPIGGRFPTERELQSRFRVGRHTAREALKVLTERGLLGRRQKTGTVVLAHRPVPQYVHSMRDIRSLFDFAHSTKLDIQQIGFVSLSNPEPSELRDLPDKRWFRIAGLRSMRSGGGAPLCWSEILVPERYAPDREEVRRAERAVYEIVLKQHGLKLDHVEQEIMATELPSQCASILQAKSGTAALMVKRRYVAHAGSTFEISQNLYPADRYSVCNIIRQR